MPSGAVVSDLVARWRPLSAEEESVAQALLDDAWAILRYQVPGIEARMTDSSVFREVVVAVEAAMVLRVLRNPEGWRQWSVDDASFTRDQALSSGLLYLADGELVQLSVPATAAMQRGAYIISIGG